MQKFIPSEKIYTDTSRIVPSERGVFAKVLISKGEVIEVCPILEISADDTAAIHEESLVSYMFYYGEKKEQSLIALGYGSLYNHSTKANAEYTISPKEKTITFSALRDIEKDQEILVSYTQEKDVPLWFDVTSNKSTSS